MIGLLAALSSLPAGAQPGVATARGAVPEELLLQVEINDQKTDISTVVLRAQDGGFFAPIEGLRRWRLRIPELAPLLHEGKTYYPLDAIAGLRYAYDEGRQILTLTAPAAAFGETTLMAARPPYPPAAKPPLGAFVNYGVSASRGGGANDYAGLLEAGVFGRHGVLIGGVLAQDNAIERNVVRLDTTYRIDFPEQLTTLQAGDTVTRAGAWGRAVRIGGVQYGTNFGLQPGFVAFPSIAANGHAALPSSVDVFVNNALVAQRSVPPGPFSVTNIPTVTGGGSVQIVVRDLLGRETLITQPFYSSSLLLAAGLSDYSVEAGFERDNFGTASADYGRAVGAATYRRGLTDTLTAEVRGEVQRDQTAAGVSADALFEGLGIVSGVIAASAARDAGTGMFAAAGLDRQTDRAGFTVRTQWASPEFRIAGVDGTNPIPRLQLSASFGYQFGPWGNINASYVDQRFRAGPSVQLASVVYSVRVLARATLTVSALKSLGSDAGTTLTAMLTVPFGTYTSANAGYIGRRGGSDGGGSTGQFTLQRNLPVGEGWGYRLFADSQGSVQANVALQRDFGTYVAEASRFQGQIATRVSAAGGLGYLGGHVFASRAVTESFGVVRVDDYPGVGILLDNQPVAETNASGYAVLPRLRAYDINRVAIDQRNLPLDAQVDRLRIEVVPYYRSGVLADFPVRRSRGATFTVHLDDGSPLPAGATLRVAGRDEIHPVGLDGQAYVTGLERNNRVRGNWRDQACEFDVPFPPSPDPLPDLGNFRCHGVAR